MPQNSQTVGVRMSNRFIEHLKKQARKISYEQNKNVSLSKLIRDATEKEYPLAKNIK
jgi:hypothetical protein